MTAIATPAAAIRRAAAADEWAVRRLFEALHRFNASLEPSFALADGWERVLAEHLAHEREAGHGLTLLAWDGDEPVGLLVMDGHRDAPLFRHRDWAELVALYVAPAARGNGLADQLVAAGRDWAHARGFERVQLYVTATNERAKRFYGGAGFRPLQEVWRLDLGAADAAPPVAPLCETVYARHHHLLSAHPHALAPEDDCEPAARGPTPRAPSDAPRESIPERKEPR